MKEAHSIRCCRISKLDLVPLARALCVFPQTKAGLGVRGEDTCLWSTSESDAAMQLAALVAALVASGEFLIPEPVLLFTVATQDEASAVGCLTGTHQPSG